MKKTALKKTKVKKERTKKFDPFKLDGTEYARLVFVSTKDNDPSDEAAQDRATEAESEMIDRHPLREDCAVQRVMKEVVTFEGDVCTRRYPKGIFMDDSYLHFNEGWTLRPEVTVKFILDYIRAHRELLE